MKIITAGVMGAKSANILLGGFCEILTLALWAVVILKKPKKNRYHCSNIYETEILLWIFGILS